MPRFPQLTSENLNGKKLNLPGDFEGDLNLLLIAFQQVQQIAVNSWLPEAEELANRYPSFRYYELPTIGKGYRLIRGFIDGGMRAGIPDPATRERTITLYVDKRDFMDALELPVDDTIYALLVNRQGDVIWRAEGEFDDDKGAFLEKELAERMVTA